jgi:hypothetical protein
MTRHHFEIKVNHGGLHRSSLVQMNNWKNICNCCVNVWKKERKLWAKFLDTRFCLCSPIPFLSCLFHAFWQTFIYQEGTKVPLGHIFFNLNCLSCKEVSNTSHSTRAVSSPLVKNVLLICLIRIHCRWEGFEMTLCAASYLSTHQIFHGIYIAKFASHKLSTPMQMANFRLTLLLHKTFNSNTFNKYWLELTDQIVITGRQNHFICYQKNNYKIGLKLLVNKFHSLNKKISLDDLNLDFLPFKRKWRVYVDHMNVD